VLLTLLICQVRRVSIIFFPTTHNKFYTILASRAGTVGSCHQLTIRLLLYPRFFLVTQSLSSYEQQFLYYFCGEKDGSRIYEGASKEK
jgi:hypothetical protein